MEINPSLWAHLSTFVEVTRSMSFTHAAESLCITQGAVSQRIKSLEAKLGFRLFVRMTRQLTLTQEGSRLLSVLSPALTHVSSEIQDIRNNALCGELYLGLAPTFAQNWLLPRMPDFQRQFPELNLRMRVKASRLNFQNEPVDLAVYYSNQTHADFYCHCLFDEWLIPVCSPQYADEMQLHNGPSALASARFIHCIESIDNLSPNHEWQQWLQHQGWQLDVQQRQIIFNHAEMALLAAIDSMGVAMARSSLLGSMLKDGRLIALYGACKSGYSYYLICPSGEEKRPRCSAFLNWLTAQVQASSAQIREPSEHIASTFLRKV